MKKRNRASLRFFSLPGMKDVRAVCGVNVTNEFTRHVHGTYTVGIIHRGTREIVREGGTVLAEDQTVFIINPGDWHVCKSRGADGCAYSVLSVGEVLMKSLSSQISEKAAPAPYFPHTLVSDKEIVTAMGVFFALLDESETELERESQFVSLISKLILRHGEAPPDPCRVGRQQQAVERVRQYIRAHCNEPVSLEKLSNVACLSPFHLQRVFRKEKGISPHDYMMQLRIKRAQKLLKEAPILDVALELGFTDQSHFSRFFSRYTGIPPGRYVSLNR